MRAWTSGVRTSPRWLGGDGSDLALNVINGPNNVGSDLLYATETKRDAFAAYSQAVLGINSTSTLTLGAVCAIDEVKAEENLFCYSEAAGTFLHVVLGGQGDDPAVIADVTNGLATYNIINGGVVRRLRMCASVLNAWE